MANFQQIFAALGNSTTTGYVLESPHGKSEPVCTQYKEPREVFNTWTFCCDLQRLQINQSVWM